MEELWLGLKRENGIFIFVFIIGCILKILDGFIIFFVEDFIKIVWMVCEIGFEVKILGMGGSVWFF